MLAAFLLAVREGLEAALIIGIVLSALRQMQRRELVPAVWTGVLAALLVCSGVALGLNSLGLRLEGAAEQIFEGITMLLAAALLTWMIFWLSRQAPGLKADLEAGRAGHPRPAGGRCAAWPSWPSCARAWSWPCS